MELLGCDDSSEKKREYNGSREGIALRLLPSDDFTVAIPEWGKLADLWASDGGDVFDASMHKIIMMILL